MENVMVDLETLGLDPDAAFISIGACTFDPNTGKIGDTFYRVVDWEDALKTRSITASTLKWWFLQDVKARIAVLEDGDPLASVLFDFKAWFPENAKIWSNGATFDVSILEDAYKKWSSDSCPWKFWNVRDVRTICDIVSGYVDKKDTPFNGTEHNALHDALYQARYVSGMWQAIRSGLGGAE